MTSEFLGLGWDFPVGLDNEGQIAMAGSEENIRQAMWMILGTAKGERVMRPDFGCGIHDLVFGVKSARTAGQVAREVRQALVRWEPRIELSEVTVSDDPAFPNRLLIEIAYRVRATNNRFNLVYPFYLE
jgi:phage baseplate assembly protein W